MSKDWMSAQPLFHGDRGTPAQLLAEAGRVDRVACIMARAVGHEGDLLGVGSGRPGAHLVEDRAQRPDQLKIRALVFAANV